MATAARPALLRIALGASLVVLLSDCQPDCPQDACEAAKTPYGRAAISEGVAGVVAYRTDDCVNDCCECSEAGAMLEIYPLTAPVTDAAGARAIVAQGAAPIRFAAEKRYERALDPGDYLLCMMSRCAALRVSAGRIVTANVQLVYGPPSIHVFGPDDREPREDLVFVVDEDF